MEGYRTIKGFAESRFIEKKSEFIGWAKPMDSFEEAQSFVQEAKLAFPDARHHVWAFINKEGNIQRFDDDGEPKGTGGIPMLEVLKKEELSGICVVVTRYFGGILLGAGGLVRAYTKGAKIAVDAAGKSMKRVWSVLYVPCPYSWYERVKLTVEAFGGIIRSTEFGADVELEILVPEAQAQPFLDKLTDLSAATIEGMETDKEYRAFPVTNQ